MRQSRRSVPRLHLEPDYNFDFAFIFAAWTQERLEDRLDFICYFGTEVPIIGLTIIYPPGDQIKPEWADIVHYNIYMVSLSDLLR